MSSRELSEHWVEICTPNATKKGGVTSGSRILGGRKKTQIGKGVRGIPSSTLVDHYRKMENSTAQGGGGSSGE